MGGVTINHEADTFDEIVKKIKEELGRAEDYEMELRHCSIYWDVDIQKWKASMWAHT